ncbi:MAG: hypothetical protein J6V13_05855 [Paludibacteraceae bacterium]|nr:hypothetical protein [Paludibacteraceae bacterium]MBO7259044.1 hypothetical protein [Paludibacteraceae bacterium]
MIKFLSYLLAFVFGLWLGYALCRMEQVYSTDTETVVRGTTSTSQTFNEGDEGFDAQALTLTSYTADMFDHVTVKNNTDQVISMYTYRIMYYDMKGTMLDYEDFTFREEIDPQMSRANDYTGYGSSDYAYYKTTDSYDKQYKKHYTIKYALQSYTFK